MNKKRLIITSVVSIFLVAFLLIGSTYSVFFSRQIDPNSNVYTTGNLDITYTLDEGSVKFDSIVPMSEEMAEDIVPYRITVANNGTVPYMFNLVLSSTTANVDNEIDNQYIMTKVGNLDSKPLADCLDNIIKDNIVLKAGESVDIDIRIWISDTVQNSEIGKGFYGKIVIDGMAVYDDSDYNDNSILGLDYLKNLFDNFDDNSYYKDLKYRDKIVSVSFVDYIDTNRAILDENGEPVSWDLSVAENESIMAWLELDEMTLNYKLYIGSTAKIYADNLSYLFSNMMALKDIEFDNLSTITTEKMSYMFYNCNSLINLDLSSFDTKNVIDTSNMFYGCNNLTTAIVIANAKTTKYDNMFTGAATASEAIITVNYTSDAAGVVDAIIATGGDNVVKGDMLS